MDDELETRDDFDDMMEEDYPEVEKDETPTDYDKRKEAHRQRRIMRCLKYALGDAHRGFARRVAVGVDQETGEEKWGLKFTHDFPSLDHQFVILVNGSSIPGFARDDPNLTLTLDELAGKAMEQVADIGRTESTLMAIRETIYTLLLMLRLPPVREEFRRLNYVQEKNQNSFGEPPEELAGPQNDLGASAGPGPA